LTLAEAEELPPGEIGELIVRGPVVTSEYVTRTECNPLHKIRDGQTFWHRMGDVGYLEHSSPHAPREDEQHAERDAYSVRFWFCGRKAHRVIMPSGTLFTIPCEAIFNQHPWVYRSALVGVGPRGHQRPVVFIEPWPEHFASAKREWSRLKQELRTLAVANSTTQEIQDFELLKALPVDIRHNAKIFREKLAGLAAKKYSVR
jgi:acyl-CoA synthetase (AMP-forming)/AMP-acid ligase II